MSTSPSRCWGPMCLDLCRPCASCCCHLCEFIGVSVLLCLGGWSCFLGVFHSHWLLKVFLPPLLPSFLSPEERGLMKTSHLGLSIPKSIASLHDVLCASVFVPIYFQRELLCPWLNKTLIYGCSRMLLGVIVVLPSFSRTVVFGFPQGSWPI